MKTISIGRLARRTGSAVSAIRFYEEKGLVFASRDNAGRRRFITSDIRRISFVLIAQQLGFSLAQIRIQLDTLPHDKAPTLRDWDRISQQFSHDIETRIEKLTRLRDKLTSCIGCGCLSLDKCALYNKEDRASLLGVGPRYILGEGPNGHR